MIGCNDALSSGTCPHLTRGCDRVTWPVGCGDSLRVAASAAMLRPHNRTVRRPHGGGGGGRKNSTTPSTGKRLRAALVLHGKMGSIDRGQGWTRAVDGAAPTIDVGVIAYAGFVRHLFEPNRASYSIDVFGHSWSPEVGPSLDALFQPTGSLHQREEVARNRALCREIGEKLRQLTAALGTVAVYMHFGSVGRGANSCERTASHLLGMQRAIQLKSRAERAGNYAYDVVMVSRWDVLWARPFLFSRVDVSSGAFALPTCARMHSHAATRLRTAFFHCSLLTAEC